jgi:hypothetical protein
MEFGFFNKAIITKNEQSLQLLLNIMRFLVPRNDKPYG